MFNNLKDKLLGLLTGVAIALPVVAVAQNMYLNQYGSPSMIAKSGFDLRLGTEGASATKVVANDVEILNISASGLDLPVSGDTLILEDGTAASTCIGSVTATGATAVTISTTCIQTGDYVFITQTAAHSGTNIGCWVTNIVDGTSFDFDCDAAETATFNWIIIKGQ